MAKSITHPPINLPAVVDQSSSMLDAVTSALGVSREIVASDESIEHAWSQLPRQLQKIPPQLRDEGLVRMCIAVASGLFDAGINYVWNAAIIELREKVRRFGIGVVPQILDDSNFDDEKLLSLRDAELLDLCRKLNLIGDDDYFFLDQCRATRNSFSAAHPAAGSVDEDEFISFLSRCRKHALSSIDHPKGVDTKALLNSVKGSRFNRDQLDEWERRIDETYDAQRQLIFVMLHGIYCDPASDEAHRINALDLCDAAAADFSPKTKSALLNRHQDYKAKGDDERRKASQNFFEKISLIDILDEAEIHSIFSSAVRKLINVHNSFDNFYNEPPFAERLANLSQHNRVPQTAQAEFVEAVVTAAVGNQYGVSRSALPHYHAMIDSFSPAEISHMLKLPRSKTIVGNRIRSHSICKRRFRVLVNRIELSSVPTSAIKSYEKWLPD